MVPLLGLFSALSVTTTMLLIPILVETATKERKKLRIVKNVFIFILYLLILVRTSFCNAAEKFYRGSLGSQ